MSNLTTEQLKEALKLKGEPKISYCCGEEDGLVDINGPDWSTLGMCPKCKENTAFVDIDEGEQNTNISSNSN